MRSGSVPAGNIVSPGRCSTPEGLGHAMVRHWHNENKRGRNFDSSDPTHSALQLLRAMEKVPIKVLGELSPTNIFFPGVQYLFTENSAHNVGRTKNSPCIGRSIVSPWATTNTSYASSARQLAGCHQLRYPPYAIDVEPLGVKVGGAIGNGVTHGCIRVSVKIL